MSLSSAGQSNKGSPACDGRFMCRGHAVTGVSLFFCTSARLLSGGAEGGDKKDRDFSLSVARVPAAFHF